MLSADHAKGPFGTASHRRKRKSHETKIKRREEREKSKGALMKEGYGRSKSQGGFHK